MQEGNCRNTTVSTVMAAIGLAATANGVMVIDFFQTPYLICGGTWGGTQLFWGARAPPGPPPPPWRRRWCLCV